MSPHSWAWVRLSIRPAPIVVEHASGGVVRLLAATSTRDLAVLADAGQPEAIAALWLRASVSHAA